MNEIKAAPPHLIAAARTLATEQVTAQVVAAWRADAIEPVLLKGASLSDWLYPDEGRPYGDADLLVDPSRIMDAAAILARLGFESVPHHVSLHAHPWVRPADGLAIDLHVTLYGARRSPTGVWRELQGWLTTGRVGNCDVQMLTLPGRALLVTIHAAQHAELERPREDLARALRLTPPSTWAHAELLADRLRVLTVMARGLRLDPDGERLLESLPCARAAELLVAEKAPLAIGFARLRGARGWRARAKVLARALAPPSDELHSSRRHTNRPRPSLALAYVRHAVWLLGAAVATGLRLRRARRR